MADGYVNESRRTDWLSGPTQNEWVKYILGHVDIDPCAHPNQVVEADNKYFGISVWSDGYVMKWHHHGKGRVYINPDWGERPPKENPSPCFHPLSKWVAKMAEEAEQGASILFVGPASTGARWFHNHVGNATAFTLVKGRIKFLASDDPEELRSKSAPARDNVVVLWTRDKAIYHRYLETMDSVGLIVPCVVGVLT